MNSQIRSIENSHEGHGMTPVAASAGIVPQRTASQSLLWIVPLTLLWVLLIYWQPAISASAVPATAVRLMTYALIGVGLWLGLENTDLTQRQRRTTWLAVLIPYTLWMAVAWSGAINGAFRTGTRLPRPIRYMFPGCQQMPRPRNREISFTWAGLSSLCRTAVGADTRSTI